MTLTRHPGQRAVNPHKVTRLAIEVLAGRLRRIDIETDMHGRVIDGQHRMLATYVAGYTPTESAAMCRVHVAPRTLGYFVRLAICTVCAWWRRSR
jgi:hypothetical protein